MSFMHRFARASDSYALHSDLQHTVAAWLAMHMPPLSDNARILEIGCGTGHLTRLLRAQYPHAQYFASDGVAAMAATQPDTIIYDLSHPPPASITQHAPYDCIIGNLVLHWCSHPLQVVQELRQLLRPHGDMLFTAPTQHSTLAWQCLIERPLPCLSDHALLPVCTLAHEYHVPLYTTAAEYLRFLRATGTTGHYAAPLAPSHVRALQRNHQPLHDTFVGGLYVGTG